MLPQIVYLQTITKCNGHCRYCPFDDVYGNRDTMEMGLDIYESILGWLKNNNYKGRIGFLLHYEPTMDDRLEEFVNVARETLPGVSLEAASNGIKTIPNIFDHVDIVPANSRMAATSRAGNVRHCAEIEGRGILRPSPCPIPLETMCIAANGDVLLCCQDWRHEAVVGNVSDLTKARENQLKLMPKVYDLQLEICQDCMSGKTAEEVGERLGQRTLTGRKKNGKKTIRDNKNRVDNSSVDRDISDGSE
jgi:hypothetical protein